MGTTGAIGMKEMVDLGDIKLEQALIWHLQSNHYPPVPTSMVEPCMKAIEHANMGEWDVEIELPDGIIYKNRTSAPVHVIVEAHHLESFLECEEE